MATWIDELRYDPVKPLVNSTYPAIRYYAKRDLIGEAVGTAQKLWGLPDARKLLRNQRGNGSWNVPTAYSEKNPNANYSLVETFKHLRELVGKYGFDRSCPQIAAATDFVFDCQSPEGDIRGFYVDQYAPHYTGLYVEIIANAGYQEDPRLEKAIMWLVAHMQGDGGWLYPPLSVSWDEQVYLSTHHAEPIPFNPMMPSSHNITGMALRGLVNHPKYVHSPEAKKAGEFLAERFFQKDSYKSFEAGDYWVRFLYPWWWNNLIMALDSLYRIGFSANHSKVREGLYWLLENQSRDGLWENSYRKNAKKNMTEGAAEGRLWVSLAICRVLKMYLS